LLPNFLIIGAAKCGTTSLHYYLSRHPQTFMSERKELMYFNRPYTPERRAWYERQFRDAPVRGEATPGYTVYPHRTGVAKRIHSLLPEVKLIYLVRDPLERIVSAWVQRYSTGDRRPFEDWMKDYDRPENFLVCASRYATQIEQYLEFFPPSRIHVVDHHELLTARRQTLREVFRFLEIDEDFDSPDFDQRQNDRSGKYAVTRTGQVVWDRALGPAVRRLPEPVRTPATRWTLHALSRKVRSSPTIDAELRYKLVKHLQPEVDRLREVSGKQFATWSL
jgi:Sulfotransferase domain